MKKQLSERVAFVEGIEDIGLVFNQVVSPELEKQFFEVNWVEFKIFFFMADYSYSPEENFNRFFSVSSLVIFYSIHHNVC